jgi:hypothetical protein
MDNKYRKIELYTAQSAEVLSLIINTGCYFVDMDHIEKKYGIVKEVFINAYRWYVQKAEQIVMRPERAESAVWTFLNQRYIEKHADSQQFKLSVPIEEAVFFRMADWNRILNLKYLGENEQDDAAFWAQLDRYGISYEGEICLTPYYPQLRKQIIDSWDRLFRYDSAIKSGRMPLYPDMQAGLWRIKKEWIEEQH